MEKIIQLRKKEFWGQECFHDVTFTLADDVQIKANRMILALCSPVFEKMFYGGLAEKRNPIPIVDIDSSPFEVFLKYIYTEEFETDNFEEAKSLFYIAHKYGITTMEAACEQYMVQNIKQFDLTDLITFAEMFSMQSLAELCRLHIRHEPRRDEPKKWVPYKKGEPLPPGLNFVAYKKDGWPLGIGRVSRERNMLPGVLHIKDIKLEVSYASRVHEYEDNFEVLCDGNLEWQPSQNGIVVTKSVCGGTEFYFDERLYIGKTDLEGDCYIGKVHPSHNCLYVPYRNAELKVENSYFQLVDINQSESDPEG